MGGALSQWGQGGRFERTLASAQPLLFSCLRAVGKVAVPRAPGELTSFRRPCAGEKQVIRQVGGPLGRPARTPAAGRSRVERVLERSGAGSRAGEARPGPGCALMRSACYLLPFTSPWPSLLASPVRLLPFSLRAFSATNDCFSSLLSSPLPFPLRMTQKENAYPWPYCRQMVRAFPLTLPPPSWRVPAWRFEVLQRAIF